ASTNLRLLQTFLICQLGRRARCKFLGIQTMQSFDPDVSCSRSQQVRRQVSGFDLVPFHTLNGIRTEYLRKCCWRQRAEVCNKCLPEFEWFDGAAPYELITIA